MTLTLAHPPTPDAPTYTLTIALTNLGAPPYSITTPAIGGPWELTALTISARPAPNDFFRFAIYPTLNPTPQPTDPPDLPICVTRANFPAVPPHHLIYWASGPVTLYPRTRITTPGGRLHATLWEGPPNIALRLLVTITPLP